MLGEARPPNDDVVADVLRAKVMASVGGSAAAARIGRFAVLEHTGGGAKGTVFAAYDETLDRRVAIKVLRRSEADPDALLPEARLLAKLRHPNVVAVHEAGEARGQIFVAMEYVAGGNLRDWIHARTRDPAAVLAMMIGAGQGLAAAHAAGIAHGDFKPENVLVADDGPRVADFGLARSTTSEGEGPGGGSPAYMAPERLDGGPPSEAADQFAFAVTLVEALGGDRPFDGKSVATLRIAMNEPPALPRAVTQDPRLGAVVRRALAVEPTARFESMDALLVALRPPPKRKWARWVLGGGVVASVAALSVMRQRDGAQCETGREVLASVYGAVEREAVEQRLRARLGPALASPLAQRLDRYADGWTRAHRQTCVATRIDGVQSDSMFDRRMQCLMQRHAELGALVDALQTVASVNEAARVGGAIEALRDPSRCDATELAQAPAAPAPEERQAVRTIRAKLAAAWADFRLARYAESMKQSREADEAASALDYAPIRAEAAFALGTAQGRGASLERAESTLRRARLLAARAQMRGLASEVSVQLLRTVMFSGQPQRVAELEVLARADALEAGGSLAEIDGIVGESRLAAGDPEGALDAIERALASEERAPKRALLLVNRASAKRDSDDSAGALADYRAAFTVAEQHFGEDHPRMGFFLHRVGRGELGVGEVERAIATLQRARAAREAVLGPDDRSVASVLVDLAEARRARGDPAKADALLQRALEIRTATLGPQHPRTVELARRLGSPP